MMRKALYLALLCLTLAGAGLHADSLILGDPPMKGSGNCDPFGCPAFLGLNTYQQVYLSSAFPDSISIEGLTFFEGQVLNSAKPSGGTYTLSFSYTSEAPGDLSLANPQANIGSGSEEFFTGTLPALTAEGAGDLLIITGTPFVYNPADGNLLLTITVTGAPQMTAPFLSLNQAQCGPETMCPPGVTIVSSNAYFGTRSGGNDTGGLVTGFDYTPGSATPEPGSWLLAAAGIGAIGCFRRRSRCR